MTADHRTRSESVVSVRKKGRALYGRGIRTGFGRSRRTTVAAREGQFGKDPSGSTEFSIDNYWESTGLIIVICSSDENDCFGWWVVFLPEPRDFVMKILSFIDGAQYNRKLSLYSKIFIALVRSL